MTLVVAWIRQLADRDELVVASDSRLSFGARWDCCPKIFPLRRNDSLLAFCGDTFFAYPILLQLEKSVPNYRKSLSREIDITALRSHFLKVIERMRDEVHGLPKGNHGVDSKNFKILFAGYSASEGAFKAWRLFFDPSIGRFHYRPLTFNKRRTKGTKPFVFIGDYHLKATGALYKLLNSRGMLTSGPLDMEPLEVLISFIEDESYDCIAGPPQIATVSKPADVLPINVLWPRDDPQYVAHFGRPLLGYEISESPCYDLQSMELLSSYDAWKRVGG